MNNVSFQEQCWISKYIYFVSLVYHLPLQKFTVSFSCYFSRDIGEVKLFLTNVSIIDFTDSFQCDVASRKWQVVCQILGKYRVLFSLFNDRWFPLLLEVPETT